MIAAVGRNAGRDLAELRANDHQQLAAGELDDFRLHRAALGLIDLIGAFSPGAAAVVGQIAEADEMAAAGLENVVGPGDRADQAAGGEDGDAVVVHDVIAGGIGDEDRLAERCGFVGRNSQIDLEIGGAVFDEVEQAERAVFRPGERRRSVTDMTFCWPLFSCRTRRLAPGAAAVG